MAAKSPKGSQPKKRKRRMRLSLKQKKMNVKADKYTDSLGWSQDVGRTLGDAPKAAAPETLNAQNPKTKKIPLHSLMCIRRMWAHHELRLRT
jgi:hypothetical protein